MDAYDEALRMLVAGAMPVIIEAEDGLHVLSVVPSSYAQVAAMINPDADQRLRFIVGVVQGIKEAVEAGQLS